MNLLSPKARRMIYAFGVIQFALYVGIGVVIGRFA